MADAEHYRRMADNLLTRAGRVENLRDRGRLIDEALHWHNLAMDADGHPHGPPRADKAKP